MVDILKLIEYFIGCFSLTGGLVFGIVYLVLFSDSKPGKKFRKDLYDLVERGRRNE